MGIKQPFIFGSVVLGIAVVVVSIASLTTMAQQKTNGGFALQVTPVTLVGTVKPGVTKDLELKIQNQSTSKQNLQIQLREFDVDDDTGEIQLKDTEPVGISDWVTFSNPSFTLGLDKAITQKVTVDLPKESGFNYSFAILINRSDADPDVKGGAALNGSVAIFALLSVDKPGATREIKITDLSIPSIVEYLPAELGITFKNTGNTFVQPAGNVFIQRGSNDSEPIATLPVNENRGYLLPGKPRTLVTSWKDGFPAYQTVTDPDGQQRSELVWDLSKIADFRIGQYTAKVVAVYNDGKRDVPVIRETTFWVIPWRAILSLIVVIALVILISHKLVQRKTRKAVKRALANQEKK